MHKCGKECTKSQRKFQVSTPIDSLQKHSKLIGNPSNFAFSCFSHLSSLFEPLESLSIDTQTDLFVHWRVHFCRFLFVRTVRWTGGGGAVWWTGGHFTLPGSWGTYVDIVVGGRYSLQTNFTVNKHWMNLMDYTNLTRKFLSKPGIRMRITGIIKSELNQNKEVSKLY